MRKFRIKVTHAYEKPMAEGLDFGEEKTQNIFHDPMYGPCLHDNLYSLAPELSGAYKLFHDWQKTYDYKHVSERIIKVEFEAVG